MPATNNIFTMFRKGNTVDDTISYARKPIRIYVYLEDLHFHVTFASFYSLGFGYFTIIDVKRLSLYHT